MIISARVGGQTTGSWWSGVAPAGAVRAWVEMDADVSIVKDPSEQ